jgi:ribosomal protein S18 acetylase RimI-like enzyme
LSAITVRVAGADDAGVVARLMTALNDAVGPAYGLARIPEHVLVSAEQARRRIDRMADVERVLLAEDGAAPAGLLSLRIVPYLAEDSPYAEVTELFVVPEQRRRGVARRLMAQAEDIARGRGCSLIHVNAWRDNGEAQEFYRLAGYEAVEVGFEKNLAG